MATKSPVRRAVGQVLRQLRDEAGFTQEQLGFAANLHRNYVGSAERGERNISIEALERWLAASGESWEGFGQRVDRLVARLPASAAVQRPHARRRRR